jgi:hypothetical protein
MNLIELILDVIGFLSAAMLALALIALFLAVLAVIFPDIQLTF